MIFINVTYLPSRPRETERQTDGEAGRQGKREREREGGEIEGARGGEREREREGGDRENGEDRKGEIEERGDWERRGEFMLIHLG